MGKVSLNFHREEFKCPCCDFMAVDVELLEVLEDIREYYDKPITVTSGCRCTTHNHFVGGSTKSQHLYGLAADIVVKDIPATTIYKYLADKYPHQYGIGEYRNWTHIDVRPHTSARWSKVR